jgi:hypothetical protein
LSFEILIKFSSLDETETKKESRNIGGETQDRERARISSPGVDIKTIVLTTN